MADAAKAAPPAKASNFSGDWKPSCPWNQAPAQKTAVKEEPPAPWRKDAQSKAVLTPGAPASSLCNYNARPRPLEKIQAMREASKAEGGPKGPPSKVASANDAKRRITIRKSMESHQWNPNIQ